MPSEYHIIACNENRVCLTWQIHRGESFLSNIDQQIAEAQGDYRLLAQSMRVYIAQYFLSTNTSTSYVLCNSYGETSLMLVVFTHMRTSRREVTAFTLSSPDRHAGIRGVWHHGVEELFYVQQMREQLLCRLLRHHNGDTVVEDGLQWLYSSLLAWNQLI